MVTHGSNAGAAVKLPFALRACVQASTCLKRACVQAASLALAPRTFEALGPSEAPGPGTLLALDAEFVAHSPPNTELRGCAWRPCIGLGFV